MKKLGVSMKMDLRGYEGRNVVVTYDEANRRYIPVDEVMIVVNPCIEMVWSNAFNRHMTIPSKNA